MHCHSRIEAIDQGRFKVLPRFQKSYGGGGVRAQLKRSRSCPVRKGRGKGVERSRNSCISYNSPNSSGNRTLSVVLGLQPCTRFRRSKLR